MTLTANVFATSCFLAVLVLLVLPSLIEAKDYSNDIAWNGPYLITRCGAGPDPNGKAQRLQKVLQVAGEAIAEKVIPDIENGARSAFGFETFFSYDSNTAAVRDLFNRMIQGPRVKTMNSPSLAQVNFVCLNGDDDDQTFQVLYDYYCARNMNDARVIVAQGTENIVMCPSTWRRQDLLNPLECPLIDNGQFANDSSYLSIGTLFSLVIKGLADMYGATNQAIGIQECADLPSHSQVRNGANFAIYAASKLERFLSQNLFFLNDLYGLI